MEDEVNEQENENSKQTEKFESNENTKQLEEFNPEIQIPDNIDINIDETPSEEGNSGEETSEKPEGVLDEETEQDFSEFDNFVPSSRFNPRAAVNPFLEQSIEPIENLERDLRGIPNRQTEDNQTQVLNAPQYSSSDYTGKNYEQPTDDTYPKLIRPSSGGLPSPIRPDEPMAWRNQEDSGYPREEQNYRFASGTSEPVKKRRDVL